MQHQSAAPPTRTDRHFNPKMNADMHSHSPQNTFISHKYAPSHRSLFMYSQSELFCWGGVASPPAVLTVVGLSRRWQIS